jgi:hypothetical protein
MPMASNYLEQLLAEWYEFQGYFIRQNVCVGKRPKGGYECEIDIVAFHPGRKHLVQVEPSMDAASWPERERRYQKKFEAGRKYIPELFKGFDIPTEIDQIAVLVFASKQNHDTLGGGKIVLLNEVIADILKEIGPASIFSSVIPEQHPLLRTFQFVAQYRKDVIAALSEPNADWVGGDDKEVQGENNTVKITSALVRKNGETENVSVREALNWRDRQYLCPKCNERVRPHREHKSAGQYMAAHFEHLKRNPKCPLSDKR